MHVLNVTFEDSGVADFFKYFIFMKKIFFLFRFDHYLALKITILPGYIVKVLCR